ncbi:MAG: amino acid adenylation domain-containing protein, partial [Candidatus Aminicenantes bacterium]
SKFDLTFNGLQRGENLFFSLQYCTRLFTKKTAARIVDYFKKIVTAISEKPGQKISGLELITPKEKEQILSCFNDTQADLPGNKTIHRLFTEQALRTPGNTAIVWMENSAFTHCLTYREFNRQSSQLAHRLKEKGVTRGTIAAVMAEISIPMLVGIMAILKAGGAYLPIDPAYPRSRRQYMLNDSNVNLVLTNEGIDNESINMSGSSTPAAVSSNRDRDIAYVIYTSGTTGKPKGSLISHRSAVNTLEYRKTVYQITPADTFLQLFSPSFDGFVTGFFTPLISGAKVVLVKEKAVKDILILKEVIVRIKVTHFISVPPLYRAIIKILEKDEARTLKVITLAGDTISPHLLALTREKNPHMEIVNEYGVTEAAVMSTIHRHQEKDDKIKIGKPIRNTNIYILDRYGKLQPIGIVGELCLSGIGLARGYLNQPELTAVKFLATDEHGQTRKSFNEKQKIYKTGDLGRWLPEGDIQLLGRIDQQAKIRGYRIELEEIENRLLNHEEIAETVVMARTDESGDKYLCAYYVPCSSDSLPLTGTGIRKYLSQLLPDYMVPYHFVRLDKIPLTPSGKVDRQSLPEPDLTTTAVEAAPTNQREKKLLEIWVQVLQVSKEKIGIDTDFFELGGHSLKATALAARIFRIFHVKVPLVEIFKTPTIRGLSQYIKDAARVKYTGIEPAEKKEYDTLSPAQKRLYLLQQVDPRSTAYNMPQTRVLSPGNEMDAARLEQTFKKLIKRHQSLRTSLHMVYDEPVQKVHDEVEFKIEFHQLAKQGTREAASTIKNFIRPFHLSQAPLLRVGLIHTPPSGYILVVDMHHVISDAISHRILTRDFTALYQEEELPWLRLQYRDYAQWQQGIHDKAAQGINAQENYWLKEFSRQIPVLNLPIDYPRPVIQNFEGNTIGFELEEARTTALKETAARQGITMYMALLAVYNVFLYKICSQEDIVVGTPVAGRPHPDLEQIVGMFVNTLALINYPKGDRVYKDFLEEVKERTLQAFENQDYPFEDLVERAAPPRDASRNPLFDTMFIFHKQEEPTQNTDPKTSPANTGPGDYDFHISKFDLTLNAVETKDHLVFSFQYCTRLFKEETMRRFINYFKNILASLLENPRQKISDLEIISLEDKKQILYEFNNTAAAYPTGKTIHRLFEEQVEKSPHHIALTGNLQLHEKLEPVLISVSYRELNRRCGHLARLLIEKGVEADVIIGIMLDRSLEMITGILGILKAGGAYLPIEPDYPEERIQYMLTDSSAKFLVTIPGLSEKLSIANCQLLMVNEMPPNRPRLNHPPKEASTSPVSPANLAYIIYTSGSTGQPKGTLINHASVVNILTALHRDYPFKESDVYLLKTSYLFDVSVTELFGWFPGGGRLSIMPKDGEKDPRQILEQVNRHRITHINFVPSMFNLFVEILDPQNALQLSTLKYIFLAGEAISPKSVTGFRRLQIPVVLENLYGPTEATIYASQYSISRWTGQGPIPIGTPVKNTRLYILDNHGHWQGPGVPGELCIAGIGLARGYLNQPELTFEKFIEIEVKVEKKKKVPGKRINISYMSYMSHLSHIYKTGDLAKWLTDGNIEFLGRIDQQVKIRGFRVETGEIESRLSGCPGIKEAVVIAHEEPGSQMYQKYLCAYFISDREIDSALLREYLSGTLPDYMIPGRFHRLERMPLLPTGKIDRKALPEPGHKPTGTYAPPRDPVEQKLVETWADVLGIEKDSIGTENNFFQLGGHSLKASIMAAKIQDTFHITLPLGEIFKKPTIKHLARYIMEMDTGKEIMKVNHDNLALLREGTEPGSHLFLVHAGSGEVGNYMEFCNRLSAGFHYWGIKANKLENYTPTNITIEDIARQYIEKVKKIQPQGPYNIAGWCIGGTIAFEMVKQLEQIGERTRFLALINSHAPDLHLKNNQEDITFSNELDLVSEFITAPGLKKKLECLPSVNQLWPFLLDYLEETGYNIQMIKKAIPRHTALAVPDFENLELRKLMEYFNMIRTFDRARNIYIPAGKIKTKVHFFTADKESPGNRKNWNHYCKKPVKYCKIPGDHFSIFKMPEVEAFAKRYKKVMTGKQEK